MNRKKKPLVATTRPLFEFKKQQTNGFSTTHPTTTTVDTFTTGVTATITGPQGNGIRRTANGHKA